MTKYAFFAVLFAAVCGFVFPASAGEVEIPSYIVDIERPYKNIDSIIEALTSSSSGTQGAIDDAELQNIMLRKLSAALYAEAVTTRTNLLKTEKEKTAKKAVGGLLGQADDKKEILSDEVQPMLRSIAERLNSIASLEAALANLEGTTALVAMPKIDTDVFAADKDDNAAGESK